MSKREFILSEQMLDAAFAFRMAKPWNDLTDSDIFAVKLPDGQIGYCCVMGNAGDHHALGLYIGAEGFSTYLKTLDAVNFASELDKMQSALSFDCINCDFMNADEIDSDVKEAIKTYCEKKGVKVPRPYGWPDFTRHAPGKLIWQITDSKDADNITAALKAATFFTEYFSTRDYEDVGLDPEGYYPDKDGGKEVPLIIPTENGYEVSRTVLPAFTENIPAPSFENFLLLSKVKALKKTKAIQLKYLRLPFPIEEEDMQVPCIPSTLLSLENVSGLMAPVPSVEIVDDSLLVEKFVASLVESEMHPSEIHVEDRRTYSLMEDFCKKAGITLKMQKKLPILKDAAMAMIDAMAGEDDDFETIN